LLIYAKGNIRAELTYPEPNTVPGSTFLKQALYELSTASKALSSASRQRLILTKSPAPILGIFDELHARRMRRAKAFHPVSEEDALLDDQEIGRSLSFDISAASVRSTSNLPDTVRILMYFRPGYW